MLCPTERTALEDQPCAGGLRERKIDIGRYERIAEVTIGSMFCQELSVETVALPAKRLELDGDARVVGSKVEYGLPLA